MQRRTRLNLLAEVAQNLADAELGYRQINQDARVIRLALEELFVERKRRFEQLPAQRRRPGTLISVLSLTFVNDESTAFRASAKLASASCFLSSPAPSWILLRGAAAPPSPAH